MSLHIIATGGTFDKRYDELDKKLGFADSYLPSAIARSRMALSVTSQQLSLQDSADIREADRNRLLDACRSVDKRSVVIIHGTSAIAETAAVLHRARLNRTIVLTSAMVPYEVAESDALFNLGFACGVAQILPPGVYTALNGVVNPFAFAVALD